MSDVNITIIPGRDAGFMPESNKGKFAGLSVVSLSKTSFPEGKYKFKSYTIDHKPVMLGSSPTSGAILGGYSKFQIIKKI